MSHPAKDALLHGEGRSSRAGEGIWGRPKPLGGSNEVPNGSIEHAGITAFFGGGVLGQDGQDAHR